MTRYRCPGCGYTYDEQLGDRHEGFLPGTPWEAIPDQWACPDCAVRDKPDFETVEEGPAGGRATAQPVRPSNSGVDI